MSICLSVCQHVVNGFLCIMISGIKNKSVNLKNATPLVENRVAHILKSTSFIFLNIFFVQYDN